MRAGPTTVTTGPAAATIYAEAQKRDEWEGESYGGTSVRAGAKYLQELGFVAEYRWAFTLEDVRRTLALGPMVFGISWHQDMMETDRAGFIHATGPVIGGHAIRCVGWSDKKKAVRLRNSWGKSFGQAGRCWLSYADLEKLLADDGEACIAVEADRP